MMKSGANGLKCMMNMIGCFERKYEVFIYIKMKINKNRLILYYDNYMYISNELLN